MKLDKRGQINTGFIKYLTIDEFKQIEQYINTKIFSPSMRMALTVMIYTGVRVGDLIQLKREDFKEGFKILDFVMQKTGERLRIALPKKVSNSLFEYWYKYKHRFRNHYLFFASYSNQSNEKHLQRSSIELRVRQMCRDLNLDDTYFKNLHRVTPHTFRHFVAWRINEVAGLKAASEWLGHKDTRTTSKYINALDSANNRERIIEKAFEFAT